MSAKRKMVLVIGAGRVGSAILRRLHASKAYGVRVADPHFEALEDARAQGIEGIELSGTQYLPTLTAALRDVSAVICAAPDHVALDAAQAAKEVGCHFLDVCESASTRRKIALLAQGAPSGFVPGCGLAPGFVTSLAAEVLADAGPDAQVTVYVGVLPQQKTNRLGYGNMWGIDGLMSEYFAPCRAVRDGRIVDLQPLTEREDFQFAGTVFEAFTTAGTLDDLVTTHGARARDLIFKTLRYPGHLDYMQFLIDDLGLGSRPSMLKSLLLNGLPKVDADRLIVCVETRTHSSGLPRSCPPIRRELSFLSTLGVDGKCESTVSMASAAHVCAVMDLLCRGLLPTGGLMHHADIGLTLLAQSEFFHPLAQFSALQ